MTIADTREKCKKYLAGLPHDVLIITILILACLASFGLGYLAGRDVGQGSDVSRMASPSVSSTTGQFVASRNGSKYYLSSCAGVERISDANKIWFESAVAARAQGYSPAANCNGL